MSPPPSSSANPRSLAFRLRIDDICSAFEAAFGQDPSARVEPFVPPDEGDERHIVLAELIRTERECRQTIGDEPATNEYLARFPRDTAAVHAALADEILRPGDRVGKYVVAEKIGAGGMGIVYRATDELVNRPVALKVLAGQLTASTPARDRLVAEARSVGRLSHPNVVTLYEAGNEQGTCYLVMEYVSGGSAADRLARNRKLDWQEAVAMIADVCRGLSAAHAVGLIHLDIKPANILLADRAVGISETVAKVSDFGLARHVSDSAEEERIAGTPRYMAPEQLSGMPTDARTDVYGVGATLYALLTGAPPQSTPKCTDVLYELSARVPGLPTAVARAVRRCLQPSPSERYTSIAELLDSLEGVLRTRPVRPRARWLRIAVTLVVAIGSLVAWQLATGPNGSSAQSVGTVPDSPRSVEAAVGPWEPLFDGKSLAGWETRNRPTENLLEIKNNGRHPPIFSVTTIDGQPAIRAIPHGDWRLTSIASFENYQLRLEYRWGEPPTGGLRRNAGIMYHYREFSIDGRTSKVRSQELELWPPEVGQLHHLPDVNFKHDSRDPRNYELSPPAWNRVDLLCVGDRCVHAINGHATLSYRDTRILSHSEESPYTSGRIQLQVLHGEIYFRNIRVRSIRAIHPDYYQ